MKTKKKKAGGIPFTEEHARLFQIAIDALDALYGDEAQCYMRGYARLWKRYSELKEQGVNVKISPPKIGRRAPLLIIEK